MDPLARFLEYAAEFEKTYADDDWSRLEQFFADDAVYEIRNVPFACTIEGRDAILRGIRKSLDGFDRRCAKRTVEVTAPPTVDGSTVTVPWKATYVVPGSDDLSFSAREIARFDDSGKIVHLSDVYDDGMTEVIIDWTKRSSLEIDASYV